MIILRRKEFSISRNLRAAGAGAIIQAGMGAGIGGLVGKKKGAIIGAGIGAVNGAITGWRSSSQDNEKKVIAKDTSGKFNLNGYLKIIKDLETQYKVKFPESYKKWLKIYKTFYDKYKSLWDKNKLSFEQCFCTPEIDCGIDIENCIYLLSYGDDNVLVWDFLGSGKMGWETPDSNKSFSKLLISSIKDENTFMKEYKDYNPEMIDIHSKYIKACESLTN